MTHVIATRWLLQTYFYWHELEERGFSREFDSKADAERYAAANMCGSRHTITPMYPRTWPELSAAPQGQSRS